MKLVFFVVAISSLQLSQSQDFYSDEIDQTPDKKEFNNQDTAEYLRRGRKDELNNYYDDLYGDNTMPPYHESRSSGGRPPGNKGRKTAYKEVHLLKFPSDQSGIFLYFPFGSSKIMKPSVGKR